jgi:hypothetical protein
VIDTDAPRELHHSEPPDPGARHELGRSTRGTDRTRRKKGHPKLIDRLALRLSTHKHVDALWVGTSENKPEPVLRRVEEALDLIKTYDRMRYERLTRDLERVWVRLLPDRLGSFNGSLNACELDVRFVLAGSSTTDVIASTIVHEATHARLHRCGVGYEEALRARVEAICLRREIAFAAKLPNGEQVREQAKRTLELCSDPDYWTDGAFDERFAEGSVETAEQVGIPLWLIPLCLPFARYVCACVAFSGKHHRGSKVENRTQ